MGNEQETGKSRLPVCAAACLIPAAFWLWHFQDVADGVRESGDRWLFGWYVILLAAGMAVLLLLGTAALGRREAEGERAGRFFFVSVVSLGLLYLAVLPPLSAPDEVSHYISAYQLSNRLMGQEAADGEGRVYIRAGDAWIEDLEDDLPDDGSGEGNEIREKILGQELTEETYRLIHGKGWEKNGAQGRAVSYQYPVRTTPLAYVPQALGLTLGRLLGLGGIGLLYLGRLCNLLFFAAVGARAVRRMPFAGNVITGAALLPMSLHLAASFSYDAMIIAVSAWITSVCAGLAWKQERVGTADVAGLAVAAAVMGPCKMVYGVLLGLCLLIPVKRFGGWRRWCVCAAAVLGAYAAAMVVVNLGTVALYTSSDSGYVAWAQEPGYTFNELLHRPVHVLQMCYNTVAWLGEKLFSGMLGESLGNLDPVLNVPYPVLLAMAAVLVLLALPSPEEEVKITMAQRVWIWFLCLACLGALMFSMLLAWTPLSATKIKGVQGRYLLPCLPALLLTVRNSRVVRQKGEDGGLLLAMAAMNVYAVFRLFAVVCLRIN